ncbi:MAG: hypothetical protein ACI4SR_10720 [Faecalibacillus sp.]
MSDFNQVYPKAKHISLRALKTIFFKHDMHADDEDLEIALSIINNNQYPLVDKEFAPVLLNSIRNSTNENTYECFKQIIDKDYLWEDM